MACRFPGGVTAPEDLWRLVAEGATRSRRSPPTGAGTSRPCSTRIPDAAGKSYTRHGAFLDDGGRLRRGVLRHHAARGAGDGPAAAAAAGDVLGGVRAGRHRARVVRGSDTGVFVGANADGLRRPAAPTSEEFEGYRSPADRAAWRRAGSSYTFGLRGPGDDGGHGLLVVAGRAAPGRRRRCARASARMALAGGVTVMATPRRLRRVLPAARPGRRRPVQGVRRRRGRHRLGRGRGRAAAGAAVRRAAQRATRCWRVVRGSAVNQDGASNGLTAPNGPSQQRVIRPGAGQRRPGPADVDAVEAHGTGTDAR